MTTRVPVEEIEVSTGEKVLAVMLAVFISVTRGAHPTLTTPERGQCRMHVSGNRSNPADQAVP